MPWNPGRCRPIVVWPATVDPRPSHDRGRQKRGGALLAVDKDFDVIAPILGSRHPSGPSRLVQGSTVCVLVAAATPSTVWLMKPATCGHGRPHGAFGSRTARGDCDRARGANT